MIETPDWKKVADSLNFPEGPAWDGKDTVYFSNCNDGSIMRVDLTIDEFEAFTVARTRPFTMKKTNGLAVGPDGALYACEYGEGTAGILRFAPNGTSEYVAAEYEGERLNRPNDLAFDPAGNLYFTDPKSYGRDKPDGRVFRIDAESGELQLVADELCFPNGLAFTADGKSLLLAESAWNRVLKFDVAEDGTLANRRVFAEMPGGDPDGMAFDVEGNLYVAHFGGGTITVFAPDGTVAKKLAAPGKKPSNVEFVGPDQKMLYITEDETNAVYRTQVETPGLLLFGLRGK